MYLIFDELKSQILSPSNKGSFTERYIRIHFPDVFSCVNMLSFPDEFTFIQKLFHCIHDDLELKLGCCLECGKRTKFLSIKTGYREFCSNKCAQKSKTTRDKQKQTNLERIGCEYPVQSKTVQEKQKQTKFNRYGDPNYNNRCKAKETCLEKYGFESPAQSEAIQEKRKHTCLEKYGCEHPAQSEIVQEKMKQTCLERYDSEYYLQTDEFKEKSKITSLEKYNTDRPCQSEKVKDKIKQTCLDRYDETSFMKTDEFRDMLKEYCLDTFDCENPAQSEEIKEKIKQTNLERYNKEYYSQTKEFKDKFKDAEYVKSIQDKIKNTNKERYGADWYLQSYEHRSKYDDADFIEHLKDLNRCKYGADWYFTSEEFKKKFENYEWVKSIQDKIYNTKKKNNTFNTSKIEEQIKLYIDSLDVRYEHQYTSDQYPFNCDFYFPDYDLYVEIQGSWTHGGKPFTGSEEDLKLLEKWKSKNTKYYQNAIETWTNRDVKKREIARQNELNYLEIFSCNFDTCINILYNILKNT